MRLPRCLARVLGAIACACVAATASAVPPPSGATAPAAADVLFVGNSLTYVGNLPAVFTALAAANGHAVHADMLVKGGATLSGWLAGGAVPRALAARRYRYVVLQERGGDFSCNGAGGSCEAAVDAQHALRALATLARDHGAEPLLMGTYQVAPAASHAIVAAESAAARADRVPYLDVSDSLYAGRSQYPFFAWFAKEGHPGPDLVLLEAVLLYHQLYRALPANAPLAVRAPLFVPGSRFAAPDPVSQPLLPDVALAGGYDYAAMEVAAALRLAAGR